MRTALLLCMLIAISSSLPGAEMSSVSGGTRYQFGWRVVETRQTPPESLVKEPPYTGKPYYFTLRFGNGPDTVVTAAIDDTDPEAIGYETLYVDANNNNDLTDDPVLIPELTHDGFATAYAVPPFTVTVRYAEGAPRQFRVAIEIFANHHQKSGVWWSAGCQLDEHVEGRIDLGTRTNVLTAVYDSTYNDIPSNGCFDDYCTDRIRLDINGDGLLDPDTEEFPLSRVLQLNGRLWELSIDSAGRNVDVKPSSRPTGRVQFALKTRHGRGEADGTLEVTSPPLGYAFACSAADDGLELPEGEYSVSKARILTRDDAGKEWEAVFSMPTPFRVRGGRKSSVKISTFGAPFKLEPRIRGRMQVGQSVCIWPYLAGIGREEYQNISLVKSRMIPKLTVVDLNGITVLRTTMEYG